MPASAQDLENSHSSHSQQDTINQLCQRGLRGQVGSHTGGG